MKQKIITWSFLLSGLVVLTACPPNNSRDNNTVAPVQQGRIQSADNASYCDLNNGTLTCYGLDGTTGGRCATLSKTYNPNDRVNLCSQLYQLRSESTSGFMTQCAVGGALNSAISMHCGGVADQLGSQGGAPGAPLNSGQPLPDTGLRFVQCTFEGHRNNLRITPTIADITFTASGRQTVNLRSRFLGIFDIGRFGDFSVTYRPGRASQPGTLELRVDGLRVSRDRVRMAQTGSITEEVTLEAQALREDVYVKLACRDNTIPLNQPVGTPPPAASSAPISGTNLYCEGKSQTVDSSGEEEIDQLFPLSEVSNGQEFQISQAVKAVINGSRITYMTAMDSVYGPDITSGASLRSGAIIKARDTVANIDVKCSVR